ncbi:MAG: ABC transporter substrate-binding protein [Bacillota bacterium]|nr:ABC transporter substrate-binding protein [Bacillota bacterium]
MMKKILAVVLAVAMVFCFAACGEEKKEEKTEAAAFKVGATGPLTGAVAIYGMAVKNGAELAVKEVNAKGGVQIEFNMQDDEHDTEKAENAYNNLIDWGMQIMMGSTTSAPAEVTAANADRDDIFYLTPSASSSNVTEGKDNVFQMCFTDPNQGVGAATFLKNKNVGTKYFVISQADSDYSKGIRDKFVSEANKLGLNIVGEKTFITDAKDFTVQINEAKAAGADVVFLPMYYQEASLILKQAKDANFAPQWFGVDGMDGILTLEGFDTSLAEGVALLTPFDATAASSKAFVDAYKAAYGEEPNQFAADAYDCIYAIYNAINETGVTADMSGADMCAKLVDKFTSFKFTGLTGSDMTWSKNGEISKAPNAVVIKDGVYVSF